MKINRLKLPSVEILEEYLVIAEDSPSGLRWKKSTTMSVKIGDVAGSKHNKYGYWYVSLLKQRYRAHRLVFRMLTGEDPGLYVIDHITGDLNDNLNIRKASHSQNSINARPRKGNTSRFKGVCWDKDKNKWMSRIAVNKKRIHLGRFDSETEAAEVYNKAALFYFGEYARLNQIVEMIED